MKKILFIVLSFISSVTVVFAQDSIAVDTLNQVAAKTMTSGTATINGDVSKAEADSAYMRDDYASAIQCYEAILKNKGESADIYYNLGNSYYKSDNIAKAILNYERALLLNPGDNDIRFNLEMARNKTVDKVNPANEVFFVTWGKSIMNLMGADGWAKYAIISFILLIISLVFFIFAKHVVLKKIGFVSALLFFVLVVVTNVFAAQQKDLLQNRINAIIIFPSVTVKSTPNEGGTDLFILHEGHKVTIKDDAMKDWKEIKLEDGNVGWVPTDVIEII